MGGPALTKKAADREAIPEAAQSEEPLEPLPLIAPKGDPTGFYVLGNGKPEGPTPSSVAAAKRQERLRASNRLLSLIGLPALFPTGTGDASRDPQSLSGRLERNPDGSHGTQSSTVLSVDPEAIPERIMRQAMSAGAGAITTWAEGWFGGFGNAKIKITPLYEGFVTGSIDFLSPIYDSERTTFFTQIGVRTMPGERIIGNMGLGQRWLWEDWAFGYNAFLDQDFTRGHMRGGGGVELWYDWLRLAANYYKPLSRWMPSKDFDSRYIQERPAEGWDARMTGYLPFYRNLSFNAAVERWQGDYVAPFGHAKVLAQKPKAWVVGMAWKPVPFISLDADARTYKDHTEARAGLSINYMFGVPLQDQLRPSAVAELATIDGSRHDFVQRQNEIILEYRAIPGRYRVLLRKNPVTNAIVMTILDGFGNVMPNLPVKFLGNA